MPRSAISPEQRATKVGTAISALPAARLSALTISERDGYGSPSALAAWEIVEELGATVHRQARLLAGKNRGG